MIVIGLTGSIGVGKTTIMNMFRRCGIQQWSADDASHQQYTNKKFIKTVRSVCPSCADESGIVRSRLSHYVVHHPDFLSTIEKTIHPLVLQHCRRFLCKNFFRHPCGLVVLEVPLLFESQFHDLCDYTVTVWVDPALQKKRVMARTYMTEKKLNILLSRQWTQEKKKYHADFLIDNNHTLLHSFKQVATIIRHIRRAL